MRNQIKELDERGEKKRKILINPVKKYENQQKNLYPQKELQMLM
ncbi:hypothetical protein [Oceanobacillus neutriphilus]|nr:hypothetical protein [Oceanobacillus neutriphilus]